MSARPLSVVSLGGGHGLYQTLLAGRKIIGANGHRPEDGSSLSAIVTVADDGGSSGRLRRELAIVPPGDLRMALSALTPDTEDGRLWRETLQHRFGGHGAMAGHAVGNLLIAGMAERCGNAQAALDNVARWTQSTGRVLPAALEPLDIEADVAGLDDDPRVMRSVRGQVAVATTPGSVRRVRLIPDAPSANPLAVEAIMNADVVTIGPGSWFSSVIPHLLIPEIVDALNRTSADVVVVLNLSPEAGETPGFSTERHIHVFSQHAPDLHVDHFLADSGIPFSKGEKDYLDRAAHNVGATVSYCDMVEVDDSGRLTNRHDPHKLAAAIMEVIQDN
ncbi:gluconeogenesis factor YvcK family protein [Corynebacterium aquatimens]|uniref:Putative gluconeogenesis factor n=1 Tax=Corynebacterium aquatimens TaxID=1190508 RepID=A0A931GVT2_9CORY|nr:uridine diphosphate-N-acetylglucosamine-binding protein YvcK [Corynebacterium aquatimens]MBG6121666.1 putative cofD-like protein [Corynebacterium aquatimens]